MQSSIPALKASLTSDPATPAAVAALRAQPGFGATMRASATGLVAMYEGNHLLNRLMDDRARVLFGYLTFYLHFSRDPADPASGLTPTRMKLMAAEHDICSAGRTTAMLSLMRLAGYLAADESVDRRQRRLVATDRLLDLLRARWRVHFAAMAPLFPDGEAMLAGLPDPSFTRALVIIMAERFLAGFRFLSHAPGLGLFGERNGGMLILASLLIAGADDDTMPPSRPVPLSISALARRFAVSRPHVIKMLRDAGADGSIERSGPGGESIVLSPSLAQAAQNFFATMFLFFADSARQAMAASERSEGAA